MRFHNSGKLCQRFARRIGGRQNAVELFQKRRAKLLFFAFRTRRSGLRGSGGSLRLRRGDLCLRGGLLLLLSFGLGCGLRLRFLLVFQRGGRGGLRCGLRLQLGLLSIQFRLLARRGFLLRLGFGGGLRLRLLLRQQFRSRLLQLRGFTRNFVLLLFRSGGSGGGFLLSSALCFGGAFRSGLFLCDALQRDLIGARGVLDRVARALHLQFAVAFVREGHLRIRQRILRARECVGRVFLRTRMARNGQRVARFEQFKRRIGIHARHALACLRGVVRISIAAEQMVTRANLLDGAVRIGQNGILQ